MATPTSSIATHKCLTFPGACRTIFLGSLFSDESLEVVPAKGISTRLSEDFKAILQASDEDWEQKLAVWVRGEKVRERAELQARMAERSRRIVDTKHSDLIAACREIYVPNFLPGYQVVFVDEADGDRITSDELNSLGEAGLEITLKDAMPDILLWSPSTDWLWAIEAVTTDGEIDVHKFNQLTGFAARSAKAGIGFTIAYLSWKDAARRQGQYKNIAPDTYIWITEDPAKHFHVLEMLSLISGGKLDG